MSATLEFSTAENAGDDPGVVELGVVVGFSAAAEREKPERYAIEPHSSSFC